jgi:hypothetical protein
MEIISFDTAALALVDVKLDWKVGRNKGVL